MKSAFFFASLASMFLMGTLALADGPADNDPFRVRRVPPEGVQIPADVRESLQKRCDDLARSIADLRTTLDKKPDLLDLLPDVQVFHKAVHDALKYDEFYNLDETKTATALLDQGFERAGQLREGKPGWTTATGLVVRGYVSKIDGSVQPYGLVVPSSYKPDFPHQYRLDFWCHGRGEKLTELAFVDQRMKSFGEFTPRNAFVLHLYGRYCCANKFAGEVDLFEAYDSVRKHYPIDVNRLVIRGFSMGGAACWQFTVHYPGMWAASAPGAGFSETPEFLRVFQKEELKPTSYEKKLWHLYDCTDVAYNLFNCPTVAYSGEKDSQKQAADAMDAVLRRSAGSTLTHIIGPDTGHGYHPSAKAEINRRIDTIVERGRDPSPAELRFSTYTLRYNRCKWLTIDALAEHWLLADIIARIKGPDEVRVNTANISAFTIDLPSGQPHLLPRYAIRLNVDNQEVPLRWEDERVPTDRSWKVHLRKTDGKWRAGPGVEADGMAKRPGLQGPIDDAFLDRFLMVRPTGKAFNQKVGQWTATEMKHAIEHWRRQFRGEAPVKDDSDITSDDIAKCNLVLWGDPSSNKVLAKIAARLPIRWDAEGIRMGGGLSPSDNHVLLLICPNPLNPKKYVVLNSGVTFREYDYLNNARQVPKLPDFAVIDVREPAGTVRPGKVVTADFFDEQWRLKQ
jgi:pimeloyl-ACP methyl ester carboxylesterase